MAAALPATPEATGEANTWHALERVYERKGRDWAIVYLCPNDLPCIVCRRPTRLMVCFSPKAALSICGRCRGY